MATLVLSTVGAGIGSSFGGTFLGLTGATLGRAVGAAVGGLIDQRLFGNSSSRVVETGRRDTMRLPGAAEGAAIPRVMGRMRVSGQLIWSSRFLETATTTTETSSSSGGKGGRPTNSTTTATTTYTYSISVAFALGEGEITNVGRIWADGQEVDRSKLNFTIYTGSETQMPDPVISAIEGLDNTPAYRGTAYIVFEDLQLEPYGNRVPQFNFEVYRKAQPEHLTIEDPAQEIRGVALIPGSGEYALATTKVHYGGDFGTNTPANFNTTRGSSDLTHALDDLREQLPNVSSVNLVVSWFGDNLKCGECTLRPKVEHHNSEGVPMAWSVGGLARGDAQIVSYIDDRPVFGGTPADACVIEGIQAIQAGGQEVMFYPFIQMDIQAGNGLGDPWTGAADQPVIPWRGRITASAAPGQSGSPDKTSDMTAEIDAFFGTAQPSDFAISDGAVVYSGPDEWSYRRFILHNAWLCVAAGGVEAFCIGSEMRSLTQLRDSATNFPAVDRLTQLAQDVKSIVGAGCKVGYAADWSEYFGYHPTDGSGDLFFHLDPLWADGDVDFIGIDNYMPLSDWRDSLDHLDAGFGSIYDQDYLRGNVAGGEGYDWYYPSQADRDAQNRVPITDGAHDEPWVYRYKDLVNWWTREHYERHAGVRQTVPTPWLPQSKPIWFTEVGCPAVDKGTNQPNVFYDPKSSESFLPYYSDGSPDSFMQAQYLLAVHKYWSDDDNNPLSKLYFDRMVDTSKTHVWAWDARPWPEFPYKSDVWSDASNHALGHWLTGRFVEQTLAGIVSELCDLAGLYDIDVSDLHGQTIGFAVQTVETARESLQPLMLAFDFHAFELDGKLVFANRNTALRLSAETADLVKLDDDTPVTSKIRQPEAELSGRVRVSYWDDAHEYQTGAAEFVMPDDDPVTVDAVDLPLVLDPSYASALAQDWLMDARIARDEIKFAVPPSNLELMAGDVIEVLDGGAGWHYRIDRIEELGPRRIEATRVEQKTHKTATVQTTPTSNAQIAASGLPVAAVILDLPLLTSAQNPVAPFVAATADPWPGGVAVYRAAQDDGYSLDTMIPVANILGKTLAPLAAVQPGVWSGQSLHLKTSVPGLQSATRLDVLNGANALAIGSVSQGWEVIQFATADLQPDGSYILSDLLRGQLGTDGLMPPEWPTDTDVVVLNADLTQSGLSDSLRGVDQHYRIGPATDGYSDPSFDHRIHAATGVALKPYAPAHLEALRASDGTLNVAWIRRTRSGGDSWVDVEVPIGEVTETYEVRLGDGSGVIATSLVDQPSWSYPASNPQPGVGGYVEVAQVSQAYGPGYATRIAL